MKKLICVLLALVLAAGPAALAAEGAASPAETISGAEAASPDEIASPGDAGQASGEENPAEEPPEWLEPPVQDEAEPPSPEEAPPADALPPADPLPEEDGALREPVPELPPAQEEPGMFAAEPPVISVSVPDSGQVIVNPYGLSVTMNGVESQDQIVSTPLILQNLSTVPVSVSASVTGTVPPGSGVSFAAAQPMPGSPVKEVFLFAEFQPLPDPVLQPAWSGEYSDSTNQLLVAGFQSTAKDDVLRLEASGAACSFGAMRLFGSAAVSPVNLWQAGDGIQASFVFSFSPITDAPLPSLADNFVTDTPVVEPPVTDASVTDMPETPDADTSISGGQSLPDAVPDELPSWLFDAGESVQ